MTIENRKKHTTCISALFCVALVCLISILQYISLDLSAGVPIRVLLNRPIKPHLFNGGCTLLLTMILMLATGRLALSCLLSSIFTFVFSVINHYVYLYSGSRLSLFMLSMARTAFNVLRGYSFSLDGQVVAILGIFLFNCGLVFLIKRQLQKASPAKGKMRLRIISGCCALFLAVGAVRAVGRTISHAALIFSPNIFVSDEGYMRWAIWDSYLNMRSPLMEPTGYSADAVHKIAQYQEKYAEGDEYPDVILILNETFFDISRYADIKTDVPYLLNWHNLPNSMTSYALCPYFLAGTNDSEFELLTSHASSLITRRSPMTFMKLNKVHSIARYMQALGYETWAMHAREPQNYNRTNAWAELGFQNRMFYDDFSEHAVYGNREETDAANYRDLISWYESAGEGPRFFYMLTYQNHGGYDQNDESFDAVHTLTDLGKYTSLVNEYLTSIQMSDEALAELLAYFKDVKRPVIVCMVGDHAPDFLLDLDAREEDAHDSELASRSVPLLIWANPAFGELEMDDLPMISMTDVLPVTLNAAGLPLSPYYAYLLDLSEDIPIRDRDGTYVLPNGETGRFEETDPNYDRLLAYYSAEYADLSGDCEDVLPQIFDPPIGWQGKSE